MARKNLKILKNEFLFMRSLSVLRYQVIDWVTCAVIESLSSSATDGIGKKARASLAKGLGGKIWVA
jgi:hypothetical protein